MYVSIFRKNEAILGTSLTIQWLELSTSNAGVQVQSLVRELRSHMPWGAAIKKGEKSKAILAENFERDIFYSKGQEDG